MRDVGAGRLIAAMAGVAASLVGAIGVAHAAGEWVNEVKAIPRPAEPAGIALPIAVTQPNPAHEAWAQQTFDQRMAYNVVEPMLIPVAGPRAPAVDGPAVILVPGGGFLYLAMDNEGYDVAQRLNGLGVRVFILKYRTAPAPDSFEGFHRLLADRFQKGAPLEGGSDPLTFAVADAQAAVRLVRAHAKDWRVDPKRVGLLGFSAGAAASLATVQANLADARPDFVGLIYGPTTGSPPPNPPPLFSVIAADDRFFNKQDLDLITGWRASGSPVEFHLYSAGGHGFASHPTGATSDAWFDQLALWLRAQGITGR
ncbi:alpha/beta hydrolase [Phenylobacterium aquaticum]|uniref:alpha/beta hydrolase n=1 Tax=Phenylobacterium aquaticum TaxID=1763816 RepID=UPI0026EFB6F0|nr:alpha/beta hydrolase [Phenylobacterium aquaticum]